MGFEAVPLVQEGARAQFGRIILPLTEEEGELQHELDAAQSAYDDRLWSFYVTQPFSWQRFTNWWAARRWVKPRDIRKW